MGRLVKGDIIRITDEIFLDHTKWSRVCDDYVGMTYDPNYMFPMRRGDNIIKIPIKIIMTPGKTEYEKMSNMILPVGKYDIELIGETYCEKGKVISKGYIEYELPV